MTAKLALLTLVLAIRSAGAGPSDSMKGWEVYSWFDLRCSAKPQLHSAPNADSVCFALLPGTNRVKTAAEIKKTPLKLADVKQQIAKLRKGEELFWTTRDLHGSNQFDLPTGSLGDPRKQLVIEIRRLGLKLTIAEPTHQ
jgi:hypothetical protein